MGVRAEASQESLGHSQRSTQVWVVLLVATVVFLGLCGAVSFGIAGLLGSITVPESASIKAVPPSSLAVQRHNTTFPELITGTTSLQEGDIASSGPADQAFVSLFGDSGSIQMYFNTSIQMDRMRANRFVQGGKDISVSLHAGTIVLATGEQGDDTSASYTLSTDQAEVVVEPGAKLRARVEDEQGTKVTQVVVNVGHATLRARGKRIDLGPGEMASVTGTEGPQGPLPAQVDLIRNGSFEEPPTSNNEEVAEGGLGTAAWLPLRDSATPDSNFASVGITEEVNLRAAVITGRGGPSRYVRVGVIQDINQPASFFNSIELSATIKLVNQALPVGGPIGDVYPLVIRIVYSDQSGTNHEWKRSFYFQGPALDPSDGSSVKVSQGRWTTTEEIKDERAQSGAGSPGGTLTPRVSGATGGGSTLFMLKSPNQVQDIAVINAIEIYGYGTEYQSWITGISLLAR